MAHHSSKEIDAALQPLVDAGALAGAVTLVGNEREILTLNAIGHANIELGTPMRPDTLFWIASQTKPMTAAALMMLVDEGKLALDDPIEKHLPEFKDQMVIAEKSDTRVVLQKPATSVTVRHILSHTAGMPFSTPIEEPSLDLLPLRTAVRSYAMNPLNAEPGTVYAYANAGTNTAGRLIEVLGGMPYEEFMQQRLFTPLGMSDTTFFPTTAQLSRLAQTYQVTEDKTGFRPGTLKQLRYPLDVRAGRYPMPAGGLFSTATDCFYFCQMMLNGGVFGGRRYLSQNAVLEMTRRQTPSHISTSYGLCFSVEADSFGHGGAYSTKMTIYPGPKLVTVLLMQHDGLTTEGAKSEAAFKSAALQTFS